MTSIQKTALNTELIIYLESTDTLKNKEALSKLRVSGKPEYLPYLITLAGTTKDNTVFDEVFYLLNELKDKNSVPFLAEAIMDKKNNSIRKKLVEACWQNGLNFASYLFLFTDLLINESDEISFEAFTVIENMEYMPQNPVLEEEIEKLKSSLKSANSTRQYFINEAIQIITRVLNQIS